ncbi:MAG TPA: cytidylate kinase-like family protein, partial [Candidatus Binatia bacterium]|nr:cytidylate kinase-like family protein [Candidatus Binatia bacterium]
ELSSITDNLGETSEVKLRRLAIMPIITIYQGASGEGQELAETVAEALGYRCVGREVLIEATRRYRIPEAKLNEIIEKGPHWWERLLQDLRPYRIALQATLCELASDGKVVYHGHLGHELLPGIGHVLKVLLTAPIEFRIEQVRARQSLTDAAARRYIDEVDKARSRRLMAMFGADWRDPNRYDLVLNMGKMRREGAKRVILEAAKLEEYQPTAASDQAFKDLTLGSRVYAALFGSPDLRVSSLEIRADCGHIHVKGRVNQGSEHQVVNIVKNVPGVTKVTSDVYSAPPEGFLEP